jgi:hypothetical protein
LNIRVGIFCCFAITKLPLFFNLKIHGFNPCEV